MTENSDYRKKLIKEVRRLQQSDFIYEKLLEDRNEHLMRLIEDQGNPAERSFVKLTGNKIKDKLSVKLESIDYDLSYVDEELDTVINLLNEMKDTNDLMES